MDPFRIVGLTQPYLLVMYLSFLIGKLAMLAGTYATTGASAGKLLPGGTRAKEASYI
jgi:hypothetical protein